MNKPAIARLVYLAGTWATFGYTSRYFGQCVNSETPQLICIRWGGLESFFVAVGWPVYWFFKSALIAFGAAP